MATIRTTVDATEGKGWVNKMNISIAGNLGSGKSSVCKELNKLGFQIISAGSIFRDIAEEKGLTVVELNELVKQDRSIDDLIDKRMESLSCELDNAVFDSRMAWYFVKNSFKVFLSVDNDVAAERVFNDGSRNAECYMSIVDAKRALGERTKLERIRFQQLYSVDCYNVDNFDLVIDTSHMLPEKVARLIVQKFNEVATYHNLSS